jgi:phenylalanyl-tRNA synthetase beta chain
LAPQAREAYPQPKAPAQITLRHAKTTRLLGIEIPAPQSIGYLRRLGLTVLRENEGESCTVEVPSFRVDLKREVDLIEEIARLFGVDKIPATPPRGAVGSHEYDRKHDQLSELRQLLVGLGLTEAQGQTLISETSARLLHAEPVLLQNPLSEDMNALRPSLLPGLLNALRHNLHHKTNDVALFEIGRVFSRGTDTFQEQRHLALAITGKRHPEFWSGADREARLDIYDLKGILEVLLERLGIGGLRWARRTEASPLFLESAALFAGKQEIGALGQMLPPLAKQYDLRDPAFLAELNLELLVARRAAAKVFKALPAFPAIRRDIAMLLPESTLHEQVLTLLKGMRVPNLEAVELFDVFRGKNVPEGRKSMAYAFTYRNPERTLTDAEVNKAHAEVVEQLKKQLSATVRE